MKRCTIGIDPGVKTGVAVYDRPTNALLELRTLNFWAVVRWLLKHYPPGAADIILENAKLRKVTFEMHKRKLREYGADKLIKIVETISRKVGSVQRESELLAEGLVSLGYTVCEVPPAPPGVKKWDRAALARHTGWVKSSNEHERDAARMCFGVKAINAAWIKEHNDGRSKNQSPKQRRLRLVKSRTQSQGTADKS